MRLWVILLLLPNIVYAATISGSVYDLSLEPVEDSVVTIDTQPEQREVVKQGAYSFNVPAGSYTLIAKANIDDEEWLSKEAITVSDDGEYTLDLILEPTFALEEDLVFDEELPDLGFEESGVLDLVLALIGALAIVAVAVYYTKKLGWGMRRRVEEEDNFKISVLQVLKKNKGRITQRQLRKELPFSEAKVSLVIAELEAEGKIKKIKKGRGNIIVLR